MANIEWKGRHHPAMRPSAVRCTSLNRTEKKKRETPGFCSTSPAQDIFKKKPAAPTRWLKQKKTSRRVAAQPWRKKPAEQRSGTFLASISLKAQP